MENIKVYAKINENNIITDINSSIFLNNIEGYIQIDEGSGDKYAHAQGNYLDKGLTDRSGRFNYKYTGHKIVELSEDEKKKLHPSVTNKTTSQEEINATLIKENADLKKQLEAQQNFNAEILKKIAELGGNE